MTRKIITATCITQANDASCINNKRGMARRAKRHSAKAARQLLKKDLEDNLS